MSSDEVRGSPMEKMISDPVLGSLRFDGAFWVGQFRSTVWHAVELLVDPGRAFRLRGQLEAPTPAQRLAFTEFRGAEQAIRDRAQEALHSYYAPTCGQLENPLFPDVGPAPPLQKPEDVWRLVNDPGLLIPIQVDKPTVILSWLSPYDPDGVQIVFRDNLVKSVGPMADLPFG